jgi:hypothetical protein
MNQAIYTFTPNSTESKPPENGRRYLVNYYDHHNKEEGIASAKWNGELGRFKYDPCRFISNETPQFLESGRYLIIGYASVMTDWEPVKENGLMDTLCFPESQNGGKR